MIVLHLSKSEFEQPDNTNMKKQINPTIKAHLIRGAFYLLLLLAVCAIPFVLARPNPGRREDVAERCPTRILLIFRSSSRRQCLSAPVPKGQTLKAIGRNAALHQ